MIWLVIIAYSDLWQHAIAGFAIAGLQFFVGARCVWWSLWRQKGVLAEDEFPSKGSWIGNG
jgi:hypothetical protein